MDTDVTYRRRWLTLLVLCMSLLVIGIDNTILNVALPTLSEQLGATNSQLQWIVDAYTIVFAGLLLTAGALGDRFGRKRALTGGLVVFGIGSLLAAFSGSAGHLIATRALMGAAAAFIMPATLSILTNVFPPHERAKAIGIWAGFAGAGGALGPLVGGFVLTVWAVLVGTMVGWQVAQSLLGVSTDIFFFMFFSMLWVRDVAGLIVKGGAFALFAAVFACHEGLRRSDGRETTPVATATCRAACLTAVAILVLNSGWFLLLYHAGPAFGPTLMAPPSQ